MPPTVLEILCAKLVDILPRELDEVLKRLAEAERSEANLQDALVSIERLLKVAKTTADGLENTGSETAELSARQMRGLNEAMMRSVRDIADKSPYGDQIKELLS